MRDGLLLPRERHHGTNVVRGARCSRKKESVVDPTATVGPPAAKEAATWRGGPASPRLLPVRQRVDTFRSGPARLTSVGPSVGHWSSGTWVASPTRARWKTCEISSTASRKSEIGSEASCEREPVPPSCFSSPLESVAQVTSRLRRRPRTSGPSVSRKAGPRSRIAGISASWTPTTPAGAVASRPSHQRWNASGTRWRSPAATRCSTGASSGMPTTARAEPPPPRRLLPLRRLRALRRPRRAPPNRRRLQRPPDRR